ncbi:MAG: hypothetical protein ACRDY1_15855, partial [Acidimicrobiales bacterium]
MGAIHRGHALALPLLVAALLAATAGVSAAKAGRISTPTISSSVSAAAVSSGTQDTDTVTVRGKAKSGAPTGTVTFQICGPTSTATRCTSPSGSPVTVDLSTGSKNRSTASVAVVAEAAGWYCFLDDYNGDARYRPVSDNNARTECFEVSGSSGHPLTPTLSSSLSSSSISPGSTAIDTATVTGTSAGGPPTGSVSFSACGPTSSAAPCTDPTIGPAAVALSSESNDRSTAAVSIDPGSTGWYCFEDQYSGDGTYTSATDNDAATECLDVTGSSGGQTTPTISSALSSSSTTVDGSVTDTATVKGTAAHGDPTGSVTFAVCGPTSSRTPCTSPNVSPATAGLSPGSGNTSSAAATLYPGSPGWYCFLDTYNGDANYRSVSDNDTATEC